MKTTIKSKRLVHVAFLALLVPIVACESDGDEAEAETDLAADSDTDADADTDADSDTEEIEDMCANYPAPDQNFNEGSVVSNYTLWDQNDNEFKFCDLAEDNDLLLLLITRRL